jgi:hypothetical protein
VYLPDTFSLTVAEKFVEWAVIFVHEVTVHLSSGNSVSNFVRINHI